MNYSSSIFIIALLFSSVMTTKLPVPETKLAETETTFAPGEYEIISVHSRRCLDVYGGQTGNVVPLIQYGCHGGRNQLFNIQPFAGSYVITAAHSGKVLDVEGGSRGAGARVIQYQRHNGLNQRWRFQRDNWGNFAIISINSNFCMDVAGWATGDLGRIIQWPCHFGNNQKWILRPKAQLPQKVSIAPGIYQVVSKHSGKCLDIYGGQIGNGAGLIQYRCHGGNNQRFAAYKLPNGNFVFQAVHSGRVLDVYGGGRGNGVRIIQWDRHNGANQQWRLYRDNLGFFELVAEHSGRCMDVAGWSLADAGGIIQWDCHHGNNQKWRLHLVGHIDRVAPGFYSLVSKHSGKCADVQGGNKNNGAHLIQYGCHGHDNQIFKIDYLGNGNVVLTARHSGRVVDDSGWSMSDGAQIIQWQRHNGANQQWILVRDSQGFYEVINAHSRKCLDVAGWGTADSVKLIQWGCHGGNNQKWRLRFLGTTINRVPPPPSNHQVKGEVIDATNGHHIITQATVNYKSSTVNVSAKTAGGKYTVSLPTGTYTRTVSCNGYSTSTTTVKVVVAVTHMVPLSPHFAGWRVILSWEGGSVKDLDSFIQYGDKVIYYGNLQHMVGKGRISLDLDSRDGLRPETMTIEKMTSGVARYFVRNYSKEKPLSNSGAKVTFYKNGQQVKEILVPTGSGHNGQWDVADINLGNGQLTVLNTFSSGQ